LRDSTESLHEFLNALAPLGVDHFETMPLNAERVWQAMQKRKG